MKKIACIIFVSLLFSCKQNITNADIQLINGYWEIENVNIPNADHKEYRMNDTFDYFQIKNNKGYRKKVSPQLDGTFLANDASEQVEISFKDDKVFLNYKTNYAKFKEELIAISATKMILKNNNGLEFTYKKTGPINILNDGKTNK
jgi:hypothetical protein